jgi:hypothetical protein
LADTACIRLVGLIHCGGYNDNTDLLRLVRGGTRYPLCIMRDVEFGMRNDQYGMTNTSR